MSVPQTGDQPKKKAPLVAVIAVAAVGVLALGAAAWFLFLDEDEPDAVTLDAAVESLDGEGSGDPEAGGEGTDEGVIAGEWVLDSETGDFDFESATGSFAGFRINEELVGVGAATAVGRTGEVTGSMTLTEDELTQAAFTVQMDTITTNESRRDNRVQEALKTAEFPEATFSTTEAVTLGADAAEGSEINLTATGVLTIAGVGLPVEIPIQAQLVDDTVVVTGSVDVLLSDYGIEAPTAPLVLSVSDTATVEFQLLFTRA